MKEGHTRRKKTTFAAFIIGIMALGFMAGVMSIKTANNDLMRVQAADTTYTYTTAKEDFTADIDTKTSGGITWSLVNNGGFYGWEGARGLQIGSGNNPAKAMTLSTEGFPGTIKTVKVNTSGGSSVSATVLVKVGTVSYGSAKSITASNAEYTFTGTSSGELEIVWAQTSSKALYIKQVVVIYEARTLNAITVETPPTKLAYYVGEALDKTGMVVKGTYSDGAIETIDNTAISVSPATMAIDTTEVIVSYQGKTATVSGITVEPAPTVTSLVVSGDPDKTEYLEGESFNPEGLVVTAYLSNGTNINVTDSATYEPSPLTAGTEEVTISYGGLSKTYGPIVVKAKVIKNLIITLDSLSLSGVGTSRTDNHILDGIGFTTHARGQATAIMFDSGSGYIYNTTSLVNILSIKLSYASSGSASSIQHFNFDSSIISGHKSSGTTSITTSTGGQTYTETPAETYGFFNLSVTSKNLQLSSLEIIYSTEQVDLEGISLNKSSITMLKDETTTLGVSFSPEDASNKKVVWSSSDAGKVSITGNGSEVTLTALAATGATPVTITAISEEGGFEASATVTINLIHVSSVTLNKETTTLKEGETEQLIATILPNNAHVQDLNWVSSDASYVTVSSSGLITAIRPTIAPVTITVTSVDSNKSAAISVTVIEYIPQVGVYTMTSTANHKDHYDGDPSLTKFVITKTNNEQENFVLGDKLNFRIGASPNVEDIMLGSTGTSAGKVSFTMPIGVYVTAITLNDLTVSDGIVNVNANGGNSVTLSNGTLDSLSFNTYANKVTLNTSRRLWIGSISIETATVAGAANHYANLFLSKTAQECLDGNVLESTWDDLGDIYIGMDNAVIDQFENVVANAEGNSLEQFVARYTYIGEKYGYYDFMDLGLVNATNRTTNKFTVDNFPLRATIMIGVIGLSMLAGYYFLRKRQEN